MADILATFGTIGGYTVTLQRRPRTSGDPYSGSQATPQVQALTLTKGASVSEVTVVEDSGFSNAILAQQGQAIASAFAAIGAQVTLGDPAAPVASNPNGAGPFTRVVDLVAGMPLPPGRGVRVYGSQTDIVKLKLASGGTFPVAPDYVTANGGIISNLAVVDAVTPLPTGAKVQILY